MTSAQKTQNIGDDFGAILLSLAKTSITHTLQQGSLYEVDLKGLATSLARPLATAKPLSDLVSAPGACFVTLNKAGRLRGCIGSPEAWRPLATDVVENANRAAFHDPRFSPLTQEETTQLSVHISLLSPPCAFDFNDEADFINKLNPGEDGLIIEDQGCRALFLPSVWEQLPEPRQFLSHLKAKAGLAQNHWSKTFRAQRFLASQTKSTWDDISILP